MLGHFIFVLCLTTAIWGSFEHNLQLQEFERLYGRQNWNWFFSTIVGWLPHHQWIGLIGIFIGYFCITINDYIVLGKRFIYSLSSLRDGE